MLAEIRKPVGSINHGLGIFVQDLGPAGIIYHHNLKALRQRTPATRRSALPFRICPAQGAYVRRSCFRDGIYFELSTNETISGSGGW